MRKKIALYFIVLFSISVIILSCNNEEARALKEGEALAKIHCASCHAFPDPALLDKKTWAENVMPLMGEFMNVELYYQPYSNNGPVGDLGQKRSANDQQLFPTEKWQKIVNWYLQNSPNKPLPRKQELTAIQPVMKHFAIHPVYNVVEYPVTTFVRYDTSRKQVLFGDGNDMKLFSLSKDYTAKKIFDVPTGITDLNKKGEIYRIITMGILKPSDYKMGKLVELKEGIRATIIIDSLQRPIEANYADLNADGREDIIICEFGYRNGAFSWFEKLKNNEYEKHSLRALPGATRSQMYDFNKDGKSDIAVLMAQGDEGIFFYYSEGNGKFREERVLQFPPSYGSNFFELVDINKDGYIDILTNNGDNGDYSVILKAYHGIRIFLNDGENKFSEKVFLPVYGAQKTLARDFDNDGDIDLASIAFFPDYANHPEESFIYWENKGDFTFIRSTFSAANDGRWMTMDANDFDGDGDIDIALGNAFFTLGDVPQSLKEKWKQKPLSLMILENTSIK